MEELGGGGVLLASRLWALQRHGNPHDEHHWTRLRQAWLTDKGQIWLQSEEQDGSDEAFLGGARFGDLQFQPVKRRLEAVATIQDRPAHAFCIAWPQQRHARKRYLAACDAETCEEWARACTTLATALAKTAGPWPLGSPRNPEKPLPSGPRAWEWLEHPQSPKLPPLQPVLAGTLVKRRHAGSRAIAGAEETSTNTGTAAEVTPAGLEVLVASNGGPLCRLRADGAWTIAETKVELTLKTGVPKREQRLIAGGRELPDDETLAFVREVGSNRLELTLLRRTPEQAAWLQRLARDGQALLGAPDAVRADREAVLVAVRGHGDALRCAASELQADREVVLAAVHQNGRALSWAADELRADREVVLEAVRRHPWALTNAADSVRTDKQIVTAALKQEAGLYPYVEPSLRADTGVALIAVQRAGEVLEHAPIAIRADHEVVLAAVRQNGAALAHAAPQLRADREIVQAAVECSPHALAFAHITLQKDEALIRMSEGPPRGAGRERPLTPRPRPAAPCWRPALPEDWRQRELQEQQWWTAV